MDYPKHNIRGMI